MYAYEYQHYMLAIICIEKSMYSKLTSFPLLHKHNTKHLPAEASPYLTAVRVPTATGVSTVCHQCVASSKRWWKKWVDLEM